MAQVARKPERTRSRRKERWDSDGLDLKHALSSTSQAGVKLLAAHSALLAGNSVLSRDELNYSLDQAALARDMLDGFLCRHGRDAVRPRSAEDVERLADRRATKAERKERRKMWVSEYNRKRYGRRVKEKKCPVCPNQAEPGRVHCKPCSKYRASTQAERLDRERKQLEDLRRTRGKFGAK